MRMCSIASGSSGNCIYVGDEQTHLLIDTGISKKRVEEGLHKLNIGGADISGILITHEHSDHIQGLGVFCRKYEVPIYGTEKTLQAVRRTSSLGKIPDELFRVIHSGDQFQIDSIEVKAFRTFHDASDPVFYRFESGTKKAAVVTDLGIYDESIVEGTKGLDAILLEANHDVHMLEAGPYPFYLKQRVLGDRGHLSNELSGRLLSEILHDNMKQVILGHLSKENNYAELAYETVKLEITLGDNPYKGEDFPITVAKRDSISNVFEL